MQENSLILSSEIGKSILNRKENCDIVINIGEGFFDSLLGKDKEISEILKNLNLSEALVSLIKSLFFVKEKLLLKKLNGFLKAYNEGEIDEKCFNEFKKELTDKKKRVKLTNHLLLILNNIVDMQKTKILGHLLRKVAKREITLERFEDLSFCLEVLHPKVYKLLHEIAKRKNNFKTDKVIGGFGFEVEALLNSGGIGFRFGNQYRITDLGVELYNHGIKYLFDDWTIEENA